MTQICRTAFCKSCYDNKRPKANQLFAVRGGTSGLLMIKKASIYQGVTHGYTPHHMELYKVKDNLVVYDQTCLIVGCGISLEETEDGYGVLFDETYRQVTTIKEWNIIVSDWRDTGYTI